MPWHSEDRELQAERELGHTEIDRRLALGIVAAFLIAIAGPPALDLAIRPPDPRPLLSGIPSGCSLKEFERDLEDTSIVGERLRAPIRSLLLRGLGAGTEEVYPGRDGWLFQRGGFDYVTGPGFLDPDFVLRRRRSFDACQRPAQPDPFAAVFSFHSQLAARGIRLVLLPTPDKPVAEPERLAPDERGGPLQNPSYTEFVTSLVDRGVDVFDPTPLLVAPKSYLATDTHWRPEAMERVARGLAEHLEKEGLVSGGAPQSYSRTSAVARHFGDLALALLPVHRTIYRPEVVDTHPVLTEGKPWRPSPGGPVLVLGDSFSNIYSDPAAFRSEELGAEYSWGEGAGLAEQLSFALGLPVDRIARNAGGAYAARAELAQQVAREAAAGKDRLGQIRVVVWQFAMRELSEGDWREVEFSSPPLSGVQHASNANGAPKLEGAVISAVVSERSAPPRPGSVPYRDALIALHLREVQVTAGGPLPGEILVYLFGMRDDRWTDAARLRQGARVTLHVEPFEGEAVQARVGSLNRVELEDLDPLSLPAFFADDAEVRRDH